VSTEFEEEYTVLEYKKSWQFIWNKERNILILLKFNLHVTLEKFNEGQQVPRELGLRGQW
jgi:hypothetical protein